MLRLKSEEYQRDIKQIGIGIQNLQAQKTLEVKRLRADSNESKERIKRSATPETKRRTKTTIQSLPSTSKHYIIPKLRMEGVKVQAP